MSTKTCPCMILWGSCEESGRMQGGQKSLGTYRRWLAYHIRMLVHLLVQHSLCDAIWDIHLLCQFTNRLFQALHCAIQNTQFSPLLLLLASQIYISTTDSVLWNLATNYRTKASGDKTTFTLTPMCIWTCVQKTLKWHCMIKEGEVEGKVGHRVCQWSCKPFVVTIMLRIREFYHLQ